MRHTHACTHTYLANLKVEDTVKHTDLVAKLHITRMIFLSIHYKRVAQKALLNYLAPGICAFYQVAMENISIEYRSCAP